MTAQKKPTRKSRRLQIVGHSLYRGEAKNLREQNEVLFLVVLNSWYDPDFQICFDIVVQMNSHSIQTEFLQNAFHTNLIVVEVKASLFERRYDVRSRYASVQMPLFICIGFDRHALFANVLRQNSQILQTRFF